uniref:UPAR/Ly6 domain-containing protein n=2 Tax=Nothobranchius furzeri TaxID=105023 RepID=A0A8C6P8G6_NOTFU|nr:urokinase plasminogen activator surface receptor [Nothobranchius furzeri]
MKEWSDAEGQPFTGEVQIQPVQNKNKLSRPTNKMYFFTLALGIWLLPRTDTLQCYECLPDIFGNCTQTTKQCPSDSYQCAATRFMIYLGEFQLVDAPAKKCAAVQDCLNGSINFGVAKIVSKSQCCDGNYCNTAQVPEPSSFSANGRRCFSCEGTECGRTLNCEKNEDFCIKSTMNDNGQKRTMKGCASSLMCSAQSVAAIKQKMGAEMSCCQGDYCNSADATRAGLLLMVPLMSLVVF